VTALVLEGFGELKILACSSMAAPLRLPAPQGLAHSQRSIYTIDAGIAKKFAAARGLLPTNSRAMAGMAMALIFDRRRVAWASAMA
jgi:hypothetical protein